jgi:hypothetical protein
MFKNRATKAKASKKPAFRGLFLFPREVFMSVKKVCVVDGQGGGIGYLLVRSLRESYGESIRLIALGTNGFATAKMIKAGANRGASGENAFCHTLPTADYIFGPISITWPHAMLGEITPRMAEAVMSSSALKILLPISQEMVEIIGVVKEPLPHLVEMAVEIKFREVLDRV